VTLSRPARCGFVDLWKATCTGIPHPSPRVFEGTSDEFAGKAPGVESRRKAVIEYW